MPGGPRPVLTGTAYVGQSNTSWKQLAGVVERLLVAARVLQPAIRSTVPRVALTLSSSGAGAASKGDAELEQWPETLQQIMKAQGLTHAMPVQARSVQ